MSFFTFRTVEIAPDVYQLPAFGARVTVVVSKRGLLLVDTGARGSGGLIAKSLKHLGYSLEQVQMLVLTHTHPDHAGAIAAVVKNTQARIAVHESEVDGISGVTPNPNPFRGRFMGRFTKRLLPLLYDGPAHVDYSLSDGTLLDWSEEVRIVHTPGHTQGSISLYLPAKRLVIVGDALQYRLRRLSLPARAVSHDLRQAKDSLKRLLIFDFEVLAFSHFPPLRKEARRLVENLINK